MNLQAGVEKTMANVMKDINKSTQEVDPRIEKLRLNIGKTVIYPINEINVSENIRTNLDTKSDDFKRLVESIKQDGIIQNLVVEFREHANTFEIVCVAGHRRLEAAKEAGLEKVQCLIQKYTEPEQRTRISLAENLIRESLHPLDIAEGFSELTNMGWYEEKIAQYYERDVKTIKRYLNIARWRDDIKELVFKHKDIFNYSIIMKKYAMRMVISDEQQNELKNEFIKLIDGNNVQVKEKPVDHIVDELKQKLSLKVELKEKDNKGKLSISFNNNEEKAKILNIFGLTL